jgi:hypothetical protein
VFCTKQLHKTLFTYGIYSEQCFVQLLRNCKVVSFTTRPLSAYKWESPAQVSLRLHLCIWVPGFSGNCTKCCSQVGPSSAFIGLGKKLQMLEMPQASCNPAILWIGIFPTLPFVYRRICTSFGGDKNGSHHICLGWHLQNLGVKPNF